MHSNFESPLLSFYRGIIESVDDSSQNAYAKKVIDTTNSSAFYTSTSLDFSYSVRQIELLSEYFDH